jgi:hypothetical protein
MFEAFFKSILAYSVQRLCNRLGDRIIGVRFQAHVDIFLFWTAFRPASYLTGYQDLIYRDIGAVEAYLQVFLALTEIERSLSVPAALTLDRESSGFIGYEFRLVREPM